MSRRRVSIDDERYIIVGWDPPLQSFFWDVWNETDELRMMELEVAEPESDELVQLYNKYSKFGGEAIMASSGLGGPNRIMDVVELQKQLKEYLVLPAGVSAALIRDSNE